MAEQQSTANNKRIAKNTIYLYFRMLITMIVGLFTSRVVLNTLGVEDYGIYNVVGGVVTMFSLISVSISASIERFLTFELGRGDINVLKKVFSTSVTIQIILAILILIIAEIVGIWFLNAKLQIPADRMYAAHWVFHCSIISFAIGLISLPYNASIVSHERMNIYAYMSILGTILRLVIVYMLVISPFDKLITYSVLSITVGIIIQIIYLSYCKRNFEECTYHFTFDKSLFKQMFGFAGWNFIGSSADILRNQGNNILLNIFSGTTIVNTAAGIAGTLTGVANSFVGGFMAAISPQITKCYASKDYYNLMNLLYRGAKFSAYLLLILAIPIFLNTEIILQLWLGQVPEYTVIFTRLVLIYMITETISRPIINAKNATGKIRNYQLVVGGILLLSLPLSYTLLKFGAPFEAVYIANIITSLLAFIARMYMLRGDIPLWSSSRFFIQVYCRVLLVAILAIVSTRLITLMIENVATHIVISIITSFILTALSIYFVGCNKSEKDFIISHIAKILNRFKHI